jgi:ferredoxin
MAWGVVMSAPRVLFVAKSANAKTGPIPVTYSQSRTCPDACPLKDAGCYASAGFHTRLAWKRADAALTFTAFLERVRELAPGTLWRHNVAGDLPGDNDAIDRFALSALANANRGRRGFTYTHKPMTAANAAAVRDANAAGFTVNLSADNLDEADELAALGIAPVVVILPSDAPASLKTPAGRTVQVCPAVTGARASCAECGACSSASRRAIIGFPAHGTQAKRADAVARQTTGG